MNTNCRQCKGTGFWTSSFLRREMVCPCSVDDSRSYAGAAFYGSAAISRDEPYTPSEPTPEQEAAMDRAEREHADAQTAAARAAIVGAANVILRDFAEVRCVRVGCEFSEADGDHGVVARLDFDVDVRFCDGAAFNSEGLAALTEALAAVEDAAMTHGPLAVPADRFFVVTRDGTEVV